MPRGGARKGSGTKTSWKSGCKVKDTKLIRVPKYLADRLLDIAHRLDADEPVELTNDKKKPKLVILVPHTHGELAQRLGVESPKLSSKKQTRTSSHLAEWTRSHDPDGIGWEYNRATKRYFPLKQ